MAHIQTQHSYEVVSGEKITYPETCWPGSLQYMDKKYQQERHFPKSLVTKLNILSTVALDILHYDFKPVLTFRNMHKGKLECMTAELVRTCIVFWSLKVAINQNLWRHQRFKRLQWTHSPPLLT